MPPLPYVRLLALTALGFALTLTTNTLEPAVLSHQVLRLSPENPSTALGLITFGGLILASLAQPLVGVLSDRARSRWGQRLPFLVSGALLAAPFLYLVALAPTPGVLVAGVLLLQLAASAVHGPWLALVPDLVPEGQRGRAAGVKALFDILALVIGRQVAGYLVSLAPHWGQAALVAAVSVPVVVFAGALALTAWAARPWQTHAAPGLQAPRPLGRALAGAFAVDLRAYPAFGWWLANRLLFWTAFIALTTFLVFFVIDVGGLAAPEAQRFVGSLTVVLGAALVVVTVPSGWLADRFGRRPIVAAAGLIAAAGAATLPFTHNLWVITGAAMVIGVGVGLYLSASWALVTDLVPRHEAARYLGLANVATAGGSALARLLGAAIIDPINQALGSQSAGYMALYGLAAVLLLASALAVLRLRAAR